MAQRERAKPKGRWRAIALSVLLHSGIVAAAVYGWFTWKHRPPEPTTLAIDAMVVDSRDVAKAAKLPPAPEPPPPEPEVTPEPEEEQGPPKPDPAEIERREEEKRQQQEKLDQEKREQEQKKLQEREAAERLEAEKQATAKAAAEKAAAEKAAAEKKAAEKKKAEEAAAAKKAADEKARQAHQAELRRMLEAEERGNALRNSEEVARWESQIRARIQRAWIRPASAQPGVSCVVLVRLVAGGEVTSVRIRSCTINDPALRQSVENAVYNASPLPPPPNPVLIRDELEITFAPE